jgi:hypothetical protein
MIRLVAPAAFVEALASAQLQIALRDPTRRDADDAARFAAERLLGAPTLMRIGMVVVTASLQVQVLLVERAPFTALCTRSRRSWVARWSASPLPGLTAFLDAIAGLALTRFYERSAAT